MVIRYIGVAIMCIILLSWVIRWLIRLFPGAAFDLSVAFLALISIWILAGVTVFVREYRAKKGLASENTKSTSQPLQPTTGRSDE